MAKNKSKQNQFQLLSPEKYIRLKARNLPIEVCYVSDDWKDERGAVAEVIVVRRHAGGNYTFGVYVVDTLCLGVKHSVYRFNVPPDEYDDFVERTATDCGIKISYNEAHNFIYGAIAFAEEFGIKPDKSFALTQYILEESTGGDFGLEILEDRDVFDDDEFDDEFDDDEFDDEYDEEDNKTM